MTRQYWLMKSEPSDFSIADLARVKQTAWTGVRNYMARNYMRTMQPGDPVLFYHSNAAPSAVAGLATVVRTGVIDETQFDPTSDYFDPKSTRDTPRWDCAEIAYDETFPEPVPLDALRGNRALEGLALLARGSRLSVQPVSEAHFRVILRMAGRSRT